MRSSIHFFVIVAVLFALCASGSADDPPEGTPIDKLIKADYQYRLALTYEHGTPKDVEDFLHTEEQQKLDWKRVLEGAENGNALNQFLYGSSLLTHTDEYEESAKWLTKAAEQGQMDGQFHLAEMYQQGEGVPKDSQEAFKWYKLAAEQGHEAAQLELGMIHFYGEGTPENEEEAVKWWKLAAEQLKDRRSS